MTGDIQSIQGETVTGQTSGCTAVVTEWNPDGNLLLLEDVSGDFSQGEILQTSDSGVSVTVEFTRRRNSIIHSG